MVVIGVDGTPYSFLRQQIEAGRLPRLARLVREGDLRQSQSVYPWVSSVAWSSISTGSNPAKHNIFGFIDRDPTTYKTFIPTSRHRRCPTIWDVLSSAGKQVFVMNVPVTYPPQPTNGILISDFLCPTVDKAPFPSSLVPTLKKIDYRIDVDPWIAYESLEKMMTEIEVVLERRIQAINHFLDQTRWDYFMAVIMETDRLHHFFWSWMEQGHPTYAPFFHRIYARIDEAIGELSNRLDDDTVLMILSDHGFCSIKQEVFYNHWLAEAGYLRYHTAGTKELAEIDLSSVAYSLDPGRVFLRVKGRERDGVVEPGTPYEQLREEIARAAEEIRDPATGDKVVRRAYRREEIYNGPYLASAADLILAPVDGYDPKGAISKDTLTRKDPVMVGMHTFDDALLYARGQTFNRDDVGIIDLMPTVLTLMGVPIPPGLDGRSLIS
ncbi:MAG TPA: alkaline phosphatase family protein [Chloroflexota bacterium]|nr:alkaline phosphatase family protein [Chloroflexota bacterium]